MADGQGSPSESLQYRATEGVRVLEDTVEAAHQILASLDEVLGNPMLWELSPSSPGLDSSGGRKPGGGGANGGAQEQGWAALDGGRLRYKSTSAALRACIDSIFEHPSMRPSESHSTAENGPAGDVSQLELQASRLKEEVVRKNQTLKVMIDQSREIVSSISMWQNGDL